MSICLMLLTGVAFAENEPYIFIEESTVVENSDHTRAEILARLTDFDSFTQMSYWSERRKKQRILFEEAKLLSITPPLPPILDEEEIASHYDFSLFLKDASFGDLNWSGTLDYQKDRLLMKMRNSSPIRALGIEAAPAETLEIELEIKATADGLAIACRGSALNKIRFISKERATQSILNRLLAFQNYIGNF